VLIRPLVLCTFLLALLAGAADAKEYSADRFDSRIEVLRGGMLRVTESVRLRFVDGTFTQFTREIPRRMTDGIEIVSTSMDEGVLAAGVGPGLQIRDDPDESGVRVTWRFEPISHGSHLFTLIYIVRGVVRQEAGVDLVAWRALPTKHAYAIDASTVEIQLPAAPLGKPEIRTHNGIFTVDVEGSRVLITASAVRANGWVEAYVRAPLGSIISEPSKWQQRQMQIRGGSPMWIVVSIVVLVAGLSLLFGVRQGYDAPPRDVRAQSASGTLPEPLAPPIAGALLINGSSHLEHAMAALFALADRGEVTIEEQPRSFGQHNFVIRRSAVRRSLTPHDQRVLDIVFGAGHAAESSVDLKKARGRLGRRLKEFSAAVHEEMTEMGLMDEGRADVRRRFLKLGIGSMLAGALAVAGAGIFFVDRFGPWPMLIPLALVIVGITGLICHVGHTPLSNDGVRRAESWRAFRGHLRDVARDRGAAPADDQLREWLPYAVAAGLATAWATHLKRHPRHAPRWFRALASQDSGSSFASLVAIGGADNSGHHGGVSSAGAAAGGGSSGAS
jgi:hypothetical protein